jgi:hypothetical protein
MTGRPSRDRTGARRRADLGPARQERIAQRVIAPGQLHATFAGACLLDHAAELQRALAEDTGARVAVDVGLAALERAAEAWGLGAGRIACRSGAGSSPGSHSRARAYAPRASLAAGTPRSVHRAASASTAAG